MSTKASDTAGQKAVEDQNLCSKCGKAAINCMFVECGHMIMCYSCGHLVKQCPVCDKALSQIVNIDELHAKQQENFLPQFRGLIPASVSPKKAEINKPINQIQFLSDINSEDMISKLTVKQLKSILKNHGNCESFCEKQEFVEFAKKCWREDKKNEINRETPETSTEGTCHICQKFMIDSIFTECGHMVTCYSCGQKLDQCPLGCSGRPQLLHLSQLTNDYYYLEQQPDNEEVGYMWEEGKCQQCKRQGIDHIFPKCGHVVICKSCSLKITDCPICQKITMS